MTFNEFKKWLDGKLRVLLPQQLDRIQACPWSHLADQGRRSSLLRSMFCDWMEPALRPMGDLDRRKLMGPDHGQDQVNAQELIWGLESGLI